MVSLAEATRTAEEASLDLVEISPNAEPPVCKVMDYGKFLFEKSKAQKEQKKKQKQIQVKEIKFRPGTDEGDYQVKLRNLRRFLEGGLARVAAAGHDGRLENMIDARLRSLEVECGVGCAVVGPIEAWMTPLRQNAIKDRKAGL